MKILVAAIALAIAAPAAAQTAPADPHQGHDQHQQGQHQQGQHREHDRDCCADRDNDGRMDCCEEHPGHAGHDRGGD